MGKWAILTLIGIPLLAISVVYLNLEQARDLANNVLAAVQNNLMSQPPSERKSCLDKGEKLFTKEELAKFDGQPGSPGLYLSFLGVVYDVKAGEAHYGPGQGYAFFAGKDASRSFITGEFDGDGIKEDVEGLELDSFNGLRDWAAFYEKTYVRKGRLVGLYYDGHGCPTAKHSYVQEMYAAYDEKQEKQSDEEEIFAPCNSEWNQERGTTRVWCTSMSGGVDRHWVSCATVV